MAAMVKEEDYVAVGVGITVREGVILAITTPTLDSASICIGGRDKAHIDVWSHGVILWFIVAAVSAPLN